MNHLLSALFRGLAVGTAAALLTLPGTTGVGAAPPAAAPSTRPVLLLRDGSRLSVPEGSPLRSRLVVASVAGETGASRIPLPAVIEAQPARTVNVLAPLAGRLVTLNARLGATVRRGQLLATISSGDYAQAVADARKAGDASRLAEQALARARAVNLTGSNAAKDVENAQSSVTQNRAELERSEARLSALQPAPERPRPGADPVALLRVTAPINGVVTALNVGIGALINDASAPLLTISNLDEVWVTLNVPENLVGDVAPGQAVSLTLLAYRDRTFDGRVGLVSPILDADTRRTRVRVPFTNTGLLLKPNMYASALLAVPQAAHPEVPTSALLMNNDRTSVFVEVQPWVFERRPVELGREDGERVAVRSGLSVGERIVVRGGVLLND